LAGDLVLPHMTSLPSPAPSRQFTRLMGQIGYGLIALSITLLGLMLVTFLIGRVVPTDPVLSIVGERATPEQMAAIREKLGLDLPLWQQFFIYVRDAVQGDLGTSIRTGKSVTSEIARYFPATLELATLGTIFGTLVGVPAGVLAATRPGSIADQIVRVVGLMGYSMPVFWL
jgi:peptide/nickel transport system permease protein